MEQGCPKGLNIKDFRYSLIFPQIAGPSGANCWGGEKGVFSYLTFVPLSRRCQCLSPSRCMCGNNMSVPLLADAVTVSGAERETAAVRARTPPASTPSSLLAVLKIRSCFPGGRRGQELSP